MATSVANGFHSPDGATVSRPTSFQRSGRSGATLCITSVAMCLGTASPGLAAPDCRVLPYTSSHCIGLGEHSNCRTLEPAPCFKVRGTLSFGVGTPAIRLSPIGSRRILGVFGGNGDPEDAHAVPRGVSRLVVRNCDVFVNAITGDFLVCPLKTDRPGWMRPICIASASNLAVTNVSHPNWCAHSGVTPTH